MNLYGATVPIFTKFLTNLDVWLVKAAAHCDAKKVSHDRLLGLRLAIDQYELVRQVQAACDQAKFTVSKMTGKPTPVHPDTEVTFAELRDRVATVVAYLGSFEPEDFVGCEDRPCSHSWMEGRHLRAADYLDHFALPNFYFHLTTAYAILRHAGVPLGKLDYLGELPLQ